MQGRPHIFSKIIYAKILRIICKTLVAIILCYNLFVVVVTIILRYHDPPHTAVQLQQCIGQRRTGCSSERSTIRLNQLPQHVIGAIVAAEDPRFFDHTGIDWSATQIKSIRALRSGQKLPGSSTITQQLGKNIFLHNRRSYLRKLFELNIALVLESLLSKERILELYVNVIEFDTNVYGIESAALWYYSKNASALTREESARLASVLPAPGLRHPDDQHVTSTTILYRMRLLGW